MREKKKANDRSLGRDTIQEKNKQMNKYLLPASVRYSKKRHLVVKKGHEKKKTIEKSTFFKYLMSASFQTCTFFFSVIVRVTYVHTDTQCSFDNNCLTRTEEKKIQLLNFSAKFEKFSSTRVFLLLDVAFLIVY